VWLQVLCDWLSWLYRSAHIKYFLSLPYRKANIGWSDVTLICDRCVVGQHGVLCEVMLSGEDLSRYSNKIESVGLRKCPYYHCLTEKVIAYRIAHWIGLPRELAWPLEFIVQSVPRRKPFGVLFQLLQFSFKTVYWRSCHNKRRFSRVCPTSWRKKKQLVYI